MENNTLAKSLDELTMKDLLEKGVHFGHEAKRWNPKMSRFIYAEKNNIHILDLSQTLERLKTAAKFLEEAASRGNVLLVATKRQAVELIKETAINSGAFYMTARWVGGLLTNFATIRKSLNSLIQLEKNFEEGVLSRTKYEVALMKKEWARLFRLYGGVKTLTAKPTALVILDINFEKAAVREARRMGIPIVGVVDTNSDPEEVDYPIPANDDAVNSIKLVLDILGEAIKKGNKGNGVKHNIKNYSKLEVKIVKKEVEAQNKNEILDIMPEETVQDAPVVAKEPRRTSSKVKGILEKVKEDATKKAPKAKSAKKKAVAKVEKKEVSAKKASPAKKVKAKPAKAIAKKATKKK